MPARLQSFGSAHWQATDASFFNLNLNWDKSTNDFFYIHQMIPEHLRIYPMASPAVFYTPNHFYHANLVDGGHDNK
jgi:hypothetical protein